MKKNLLIVCGLVLLSGIFFLMFNNIKTNAQVKNNQSANNTNSNRKTQSNAPNRATNAYAGNAFISNTGEFIEQSKANGIDITTIEDAGVTVIFPKGFEVYDVSKMYDYEAEYENRQFNTRAHLHSVNSDFGIDLIIKTSRNLSFENSIIRSGDLIVGGNKFTLLKSGVRSTINGFEVVSSNGKIDNQVWRMDAFKTNNGALIVVTIGFPEDMKKNQNAVQTMLQSIKLK